MVGMSMRLRTVDDDDEKQEEEAQDKLLLGATLLFTLLLSLSLSIFRTPQHQTQSTKEPAPMFNGHLPTSLYCWPVSQSVTRMLVEQRLKLNAS